MEARVKPYYAPEGLMEVAYDFEDVIDDLIILRSASKQSKVRNWKRCLLLIRIHKKLKLIESNVGVHPLVLRRFFSHVLWLILRRFFSHVLWLILRRFFSHVLWLILRNKCSFVFPSSNAYK